MSQQPDLPTGAPCIRHLDKEHELLSRPITHPDAPSRTHRDVLKEILFPCHYGWPRCMWSKP